MIIAIEFSKLLVDFKYYHWLKELSLSIFIHENINVRFLHFDLLIRHPYSAKNKLPDDYFAYKFTQWPK